MSAIPDQLRIAEALRSLDLLVHSDVQMSPTARLADYVIASTLPYEMPSTTLMPDFLSQFGTGWGYRRSFAQYTPALVERPPGSDVVENWRFLYLLARELDLELELFRGLGDIGSVGVPVNLDMAREYTGDELMDIVHEGSRVPLDIVRGTDGGAFYPDESLEVGPKADGWEGRLDVGCRELMEDLGRIADQPVEEHADYPFRLVCRRQIHVMNQPGLAYPANRPRHNPAFMNPADLEELGVGPGDHVTLASPHAQIDAVVEIDTGLRRGLISMSHSYGDLPGENLPLATVGANPGRLIDVEDLHDRHTGQPRMSNIPVAVTAH